ncbi:MAG: tannase/feruloyl esterase family alpha/beta hydrolase [Gammaproteobacteria bacterium]
MNTETKSAPAARLATTRRARLPLVAALGIAATAFCAIGHAQTKPVTTCDAAGIGAAKLTADKTPKILEAAPAMAGKDADAVSYCLVKVLVPEAINIWVGLPMEGKWNGKLQSIGGGGYAGTVVPPAAAVQGGYVGITTDTGHTGSDGTFGMKSPGVANKDLWVDFAYRSEHLMSVVGKQLAQAFYGKAPRLSYWNGCSTGGRQGLMMAQRFPEDYNGILAGAPAIHWDRFQAAQIWPQVAMLQENGGAVDAKKITLASNAAIEACDGLDGVKDGVLEEPRACKFDAKTLVCAAGASGDSCLTAGEAAAINKIWEGPKGHWYGLTRSTPVQQMLAGAQPFMISINQPRYWVYLDPTWDWKTLTYQSYGKFFDDSVRVVGPVMGTDDPDLDAFRKHGGKLILWHGWSDPGIMPEGTVDYYEKVAKRDGGDFKKTREFARLFMAPGVGHCAGGAGPQPQGMFDSLVSWVEKGKAPETILASKPLPDGKTRTRPLCQYPAVASYKGEGSTDDAGNFRCVTTKAVYRN